MIRTVVCNEHKADDKGAMCDTFVVSCFYMMVGFNVYHFTECDVSKLCVTFVCGTVQCSTHGRVQGYLNVYKNGFEAANYSNGS